MNIEGMYQEVLLDAYRNPKNKGRLQKYDLEAKDVNPACGDKVNIQAKVENGRIKEIKFEGEGCIICMASASMLTEYIKGKKLHEVKNVQKEEALKLIPITLSPLRIKCGLLPLKVVKLGIYTYLGEKNHESDF